MNSIPKHAHESQECNLSDSGTAVRVCWSTPAASYTPHIHTTAHSRSRHPTRMPLHLMDPIQRIGTNQTAHANTGLHHACPHLLGWLHCPIRQSAWTIQRHHARKMPHHGQTAEFLASLAVGCAQMHRRSAGLFVMATTFSLAASSCDHGRHVDHGRQALQRRSVQQQVMLVLALYAGASVGKVRVFILFLPLNHHLAHQLLHPTVHHLLPTFVCVLLADGPHFVQH
jgi:hypothetical protein